MLRQFWRKMPREVTGACQAFLGKFGGPYAPSFLFCSLGRAAALRPQHRPPTERALALRAVSLLRLQYALVLAGQHIVANPQQRAVRQRHASRQPLVVDK